MNNEYILAMRKQRPSVIRWIGKKLNYDTCDIERQEFQVAAAAYQRKSYDPDDANPDSRCQKVVQEASISKASFSKPIDDKNKYHCLFCGKTFQWYSHWRAHERVHTGERPFKCELCGKAFTRSDGLQSHKLTHVPKKSFPQNHPMHVVPNSCAYEQCDQAMATNVSVSTAVRYLDDNILECRFCGRTCYRSGAMFKHLEEHKEKKELKCDICHKQFDRPSALKIHSRTHTGIRPYRCNLCTKAFSIYGNLKRHLLVHTGERPYSCSQCFNSFNNSSHLKRHIKTKHEASFLSRSSN